MDCLYKNSEYWSDSYENDVRGGLGLEDMTGRPVLSMVRSLLLALFLHHRKPITASRALPTIETTAAITMVLLEPA